MSKIVYKKYSCDSKNLSTLFLVLFWLSLFFIIFIIGVSDVFASTYDTFDVTWYYRNKSNENTLLNVVKNQDTALYASTSEYVNGYTTRLEQTFSKDIQYIINYELQMSFSPEQELVYRSDTLDRIINYSYTDSDFKILNITATEDWNRSISIGDTFLTIKVSMQVLALNNTNAIRFGVYTTNNISIGFYNHTEQIDYYLLDNISIEENANATIIDQNNQIINGQNGINDNITNSTNTITGSINETENNINQNIDDMEQSIVDSNKETQDVIKDQFNSCRPSNNLFDISSLKNGYDTTHYLIENGFNAIGSLYILFPFNVSNGTYTLTYNYKVNSGNISSNTGKFRLRYTNGDYSIFYNSGTSFTINKELKEIMFYTDNGTESINIDFTNIMLQKGSIATNYEPYGEEICTNKLDEQNETSKGIWATIKDLPNAFLDMLLGLFIPDDLSFIDNFKDVISNKLGFIASIPIQIIDFALGLVNVAFEEITTISFPSFEVFGVRFWNAEDIDITILLDKLKPFKYLTDLTCVILCCRTLYDMYHNFTGGGAN